MSAWGYARIFVRLYLLKRSRRRTTPGSAKKLSTMDRLRGTTGSLIACFTGAAQSLQRIRRNVPIKADRELPPATIFRLCWTLGTAAATLPSRTIFARLHANGLRLERHAAFLYGW